MQSFVDIDSTTKLKASRELLLNNDKTIMSCNSGTIFPTQNLEVGMLCLRTDQNKLYQLKDKDPTWVLIADLADTNIYDADTLDGNHGSYYSPINSPVFTGTPTAPTAAVGTNTQQLATTAFVNAEIANDAPTKTGGGASGTWGINITGNSSNANTVGGLLPSQIIPTGVIVMWSGAIASVPSGWSLCNGSNGTPDLRNRFVLGAGSSYAVGATGGEVMHTLTIDEMPAHTHSYVMPPTGRDNMSRDDLNHQFGWNSNSTTGSTGGSQPHNNMPPYYALAYIMKL